MSDNKATWTLNERIDVCRGLFAILVVVDHAMQVTWGIHRGVEASLNPFVRECLNALLGSSTVYVMGFFVLSGYCIEVSVARLLKNGEFPVATYTRARASRILPLYYAALLFAVAVEWAIASSRPFTWPNGIEDWVFGSQLLLLQNVTQTYGSFVASWSITNEVFYYAAYGCLAWLFAKSPKTPAMLGLALCLLTAAITQGLYVTSARTPFVYGLGMLFGLGMIWFVGVLVAQRGETWLRSRWVRVVARFWPLVFLSSLVWKGLHLPPQGIYLIPGLAFMLMMLRFIDLERIRLATEVKPRPAVSARRAWAVESLGLMSYPMYLFHGPLLMLVGSILMRTGTALDWRATWAILVASGLSTGLAMGWWVERPFMIRRSAWLKSKRVVEPSARVPMIPSMTAPG